MTELKLLLESPEMATHLIGVMEALRHAEKKHPHWSTNTFEQVSIITEEAGEITKAANDGDHQGMKTELYQTAAMCLRMLKNL
jgi:NTP pyrophosphatase (non-canonical NTP hydrolase)